MKKSTRATASQPAPYRQTVSVFVDDKLVRETKLRLDAAALRQAKRFARIFGLDVKEFLDKAFTGDLPGQRSDREPLRSNFDAEDIRLSFSAANPALAQRIEAAARYARQSTAEFVADAIGSFVDCCEETALFHPETGAPLHDDTFDLSYWIESHNIGGVSVPMP